MKKLGLILLTCICAGAMFSAEAYSGKNVNAKAVSVQWRYAKDNSVIVPEGLDGGTYSEAQTYDGSILVYTITNGIVTKKDTVYDKVHGLAQYAAFDLTGTRIAFFRKSKAPSGPNLITANDGKSHVSIINIDGTGLRDLCDQQFDAGKDCALDWPAGEWIYYVNPKETESGSGIIRNSMSVWKVKATTGENTIVCDFAPNKTDSWFRRFSLDIFASKMAVNEQWSAAAASANPVYTFPPTNCTTPGSSQLFNMPGCNIAICASGSFIGRYESGYHLEVYLFKTNDQTQLIAPNPPLNQAGVVSVKYYKIGDCDTSTLETWSGESLGAGCEHIGFAVNSDKWMLQEIGWLGHFNWLAQGSNQVVANWEDKVAINISKNPPPPLDFGNNALGICTNNSTGDFWVDDPVNNPRRTKYEDLQGVWHEVPGATPYTGNVGAATHEPSIRSANQSARFSMSDGALRSGLSCSKPWTLSLATVNGKTIRSIRGISTQTEMSIAGISKGIHLVKLSTGGQSFVDRVILK